MPYKSKACKYCKCERDLVRKNSNTVRGAICQRCNNVLAYLEERDVLVRALQYLEVH